MTTFFVCGNDETICDGYTDDRTAAWEKEIGLVFVEAAVRQVRRRRVLTRSLRRPVPA